MPDPVREEIRKDEKTGNWIFCWVQGGHSRIFNRTYSEALAELPESVECFAIGMEYKWDKRCPYCGKILRNSLQESIG